MLGREMFFNKNIFFLLFLLLFSHEVSASIKQEILYNLEEIDNLQFNFEQNINGKTENGICIIEYPKKIHCKYNSNNNKILVSNGKSLVIKTSSSYYVYPLKKTTLDFILNKKFILKKIADSEEQIVNEKYVNFLLTEGENQINIFFDINSLNLIGWQTLDIYQNLVITYISSVIKNQKMKKNLFRIPEQN